ncbi:unnamed protein product [Acanthoscelides obtectus]|uniref:Kinesin motor domain-containing protein n=1 Tax=Acanthoscelides obtectus TaxID=200917 RepID=A0A9P0VQY4_ACAOB|nr:unnamed protein product [Acanthoscelides obtectus]CAK1685635.1 Centromere-associated protein E [Acanthoscelides obtectus]
MENMMQGNKIRRVAATRMNERSSRSHTIFRIILESKDANQKDGPVHISYLNLMDLAGSERVSLTKAAGERLKEGANINKSLSVLGNVIRQLSEGKEFISYRDSKLTRLLSQALGGNAKSLIIGNINDLLDKSNQGLTIREDIKGNVLLDAREAVVDNVDKVMENMMQGNKIRRVAATRMNERSSRSHTIFRIILESKDANQKDGPVHISYLNLMDLAGSERVSLTKAAGERLKEGANINKSLSVLGNVIRQLSEGKEFISYRDSKLTRLLSQALGGNAKSLIIGNIRPMIHREVADGLERLWNVRVNCIWEADESSRHGEVYIFDHVFNQECTNSDVYGSVVKPLVDSFMEGFNATIFAYGQTSSGKTHTILGNKTDPGLFQLVSNQLFQHVADQVDKRYLIRCSYIEIYNEKINDLLDKSNQGLTMRRYQRKCAA